MKYSDQFSKDLPYISRAAKVIYDWRWDLQKAFDLKKLDDQIFLIFWMLRDSHGQFPEIKSADFLTPAFARDYLTPTFEATLSPGFKVAVAKIASNLLIMRPDVMAGSTDLNNFSGISWLFLTGCHEYRLELDTIFPQLKDPKSEVTFYSLFSKFRPDLPDPRTSSGRKALKESFPHLSTYLDNKVEEGEQGSHGKSIQQPADLALVLGLPKVDIGIGEDARTFHSAFSAIFPKTITVDSPQTVLNTSIQNFEDNLNDIVPKLFFVSLPAPEIYRALPNIPKSWFGSKSIANCPWELPHWPESLNFVLEIFDQIWVNSDFVVEGVPKEFRHKVRKAPLVVRVPEASSTEKHRFLDADKFYFMSTFDFASWASRKNPDGVIKAYNSACEKNSEYAKSTRLIIKANNADKFPELELGIKNLCNSNPNVRYISDHLLRADLMDLYRQIDSFVSLHRSEGFGRNIAEAMLFEKPTIVTGFSGNMDFCNNENSYLCSFKIRNIEPEEYPFAVNQQWAEPDLNHAKDLMIEVFQDQAEARRKGKNASKLMTKQYSQEAVVHWIKETLNSL